MTPARESTSPPPSAGAAERQLIVNGDDFGRTEGLTRGIVKCFQEGILTSASMVANGAAFELAAVLAKENPELGVGIHVAFQRIAMHHPLNPSLVSASI